MAELLRLKPRPDGVFCYNDPLATGAMDYALEKGSRIPEDVAIIGCGNLHYDDSLLVPLSSVDQRSARVGERAAQLILQHVVRGKYDDAPDDASQVYANIQLKPEVIVRESSKRK